MAYTDDHESTEKHKFTTNFTCQLWHVFLTVDSKKLHTCHLEGIKGQPIENEDETYFIYHILEVKREVPQNKGQQNRVLCEKYSSDFFKTHICYVNYSKEYEY